MNNQELIQFLETAHSIDKTPIQHTQTTVTAIVGVLRRLSKEYDDPKLLKISDELLKELKLLIEI